jgi:hypothetical protein
MPFKIFAAEVSRLGPVGIIITTVFRNAGGYPRAESFLVLPGKPPISKRCSFDFKSFADPTVELNDDFLFEEALGQAKIDLQAALEEQYHNNPQHKPLGTVTESNLNLLVHTRVRGDGVGLDGVSDLTECDELRSNLDPILRLPVVKFLPMNQ